MYGRIRDNFVGPSRFSLPSVSFKQHFATRTVQFGLSGCCIKWHILINRGRTVSRISSAQYVLQTRGFTLFCISLVFLIISLVNLTENLLFEINLSTVSCICVKRPLQPITIHVTTMTKLRPFHSLHEFVWFPVNLVYCNQISYISPLPPLVCEVSLHRSSQTNSAINHNSPAVKDKLWNS